MTFDEIPMSMRDDGSRAPDRFARCACCGTVGCEMVDAAFFAGRGDGGKRGESMTSDDMPWMGATAPGWTVTVIQARYGGSCEGGEWICFPCAFYEVPQEAVGGDGDAMDFWEGSAMAAAVALIGRGATPNEAEADMRRRWATVADGRGGG